MRTANRANHTMIAAATLPNTFKGGFVSDYYDGRQRSGLVTNIH